MKRNTILLLMLGIVTALGIAVVSCETGVSDSSDNYAEVTVSGLWGKNGKFISVFVYNNEQESNVPFLTTKRPLPEITSETMTIRITQRNIHGFTANGIFRVGISLYGTADSTSTSDFKYFSDVLFESAKANVVYETNHGVTLNTETLSLTVGETAILTASISPTNAVDKTVTWESSDTDIVTVVNGTVTAKAAGTATITVTTTDGSYSAECAVTVNPPIAVTGVSLNENILELFAGETLTLTATVLPDDAANKTVTWGSSDTDIATVVNGTVTAKAVGTATITVTTTDGSFTAECDVTVNPIVVTGVSLNENILELFAGETSTLTATVHPDDATNKTVTWESSDTSIVTVVNGTVTAKAAGTATITVTTTDGSFTAECVVTVNPIVVTDVTLSGGKLYYGIMSLALDETTTLNVNIAPFNASDTTVTWESSDTDIVTVENGTVTAKAVGTATITVTTTDGGKTVSCTVYVLDPADFCGTWINDNFILYGSPDEVWTVTIVIENNKIDVKYISNTGSTSYNFTVDNLTWRAGTSAFYYGQVFFPNTDFPLGLEARGILTESTAYWASDIGSSVSLFFFYDEQIQCMCVDSINGPFIKQP